MITRVLICAALGAVLSGCVQGPSAPNDAASLAGFGTAATTDELRALEETYGIVPLGIRTTAAGYALDFRYRVVDADKAAPIMVRRNSPDPKVIVERSGAVLRVPFSEKVGSMRQSVGNENQVKANRNYFVLFANPGRHVKPGDQVTIQIGDYRQEHVTVQ